MKFSYVLLKKLLPKVPPQKKLVDVFGLRVFEIEKAKGDMIDVKLPANRYSDCASHIGMAREAAAAFRLPFKSPAVRIVNAPENQGRISLKVEDEKLCPRYGARYFELSRKISASPAWMQKILKTCGVRPINAVVDAMNYAMLETGQPLHAFDADTLSKNANGAAEIIVRKAHKGEYFKTLDDQAYNLGSSELVISDAKRALALAGIKGGKDSGVTARTKRIVVEAANFEQANIQKTAQRLKLHTDAAARFGHGMSPALVDAGLDRATELLTAIGAKTKDTVHAYPNPVGDELIPFDTASYEALIGSAITLKEAQEYFSRLGFGCKPSKKNNRTLEVRIPKWRNDISIPEDLIEEAARLKGYDTLPARAPVVALGEAHEEDTVILKDRVRDFLVRMQMDEVSLHSFIARASAENAIKAEYQHGEAEPVELENPASAELECLRSSMMPGLAGAVTANARHLKDVRIFEIGAVFANVRGTAKEERHLGMALARKKESYFRELKGIAHNLLESFGITDIAMIDRGSRLYIESDHTVLGVLEALSLSKGLEVALGEIYLDKLMKLVSEEMSFKPLAKYPAVERDISLLMRDNVRVGHVLEVIQGAGGDDVVDVDFVDQYSDDTLGRCGMQSITFRIVFQSEKRTLTDSEVSDMMKKIEGAVRKKFSAEIR